MELTAVCQAPRGKAPFTKLWKVMRLLTFFLFLSIMHVSARTRAQSVNLNLREATLKQALSEISRQSGYAIFGDQDLLESAPRITLSLQNVTVADALAGCLRGMPFSYEIKGMAVYIRPVAPSPPDTAGFQGRVTDAAGVPLAGANIIIKRTGYGTETDANGHFSLKGFGLTSSDVLVVSYVGFKTISIPVRGRGNVVIIMEAATNELDKLVVQGYGTTSQRFATGNIATVTSEQIARQPVMNPLDALQGQVPGLLITSGSGYASGTVKAEIRGRSTINPNAVSDPLYIIDGVPLTILDVGGYTSYQTGSSGFLQTGVFSPAGGQSPFFNVNPSDIESIEVLKDADATAIYGSRGANGVILITTKKGKAGKTHFDLNVYTGEKDINRHYQMLNTPQYLAMRREALRNDGLSPDINTAPDMVAWDTTRYTDWQKLLWGNPGKITNVQSSLTGGDVRTTFRFSAGYRRESEALVQNGANHRASFSFNTTHNSLDQRLTLSVTGNYTYTLVNTIYIPSAATLPPDAPAIYDKNGNLNFNGWAPLQNIYPFQSLFQPYTSKTNFLNAGAMVQYVLLKGLTAKVDLGYNNAISSQTIFTPIASQNPQYNPTGQSFFGYNYIHNIITEPQLNYSTILGRGSFNALVGGTYQGNTTEGVGVTGGGYTDDALIRSINNAPSKFVGDNYGEYHYDALFGRLNYNWRDKLIVNLNARRDGSSRFGPGRQFGNFGSAGVAWIFSEEAVVKDHLPWLSFGKVRASYGTTGNDQIGDYKFLSQWYAANSTYAGTLPLIPAGHSDSLLQWEVNKKAEVALDLGFLRDRIHFQVALYRNRCNNQLVQFPTPYFTGFNQVTANSPADVQNVGWEFLLNATLLETKNFKWTVRANLGINRNKLLAYPNLTESPYSFNFIVGKPLNIVKLLHSTGVDPQTGLYTFQDRVHAGQVYIDYTGRTPDDLYPYDLTPKYYGGVTFGFTYQRFDLSIFFYYIRQNGVSALGPQINPGSIANEPTAILNHWQKPGDVSDVARFTTNPYNNETYAWFNQMSDGVYCNASYIRLENLSLSYRLKGNKARVFVQGNNLFIITPYKGIDPEIQNFGGLPKPRIVTAGVSCTL